METIKYKEYSGTVEYSEEDNSLLGKVIGMNKNVITYEGNTKLILSQVLIYIF